MKLLVLIPILVVLTAASPYDDVRRKYTRTESRIMNGLPAAENQFPYQAFLLGIRSIQDIVECAGVLISPRWVLTSGQCTKGFTMNYVSLGFVNIDDPEIIVLSHSIYSHENYSTSYLNNDIGLIELNEDDVTLTDSVNIIKLLGRNSVNNTFEGEPAQISGNGKLNNTDATGQIHLRYGNVTVISNEECAEFFGRKAVTDATICTRGPSKGEFNMCQGDQGGPLISWTETGEPFLLGLASFGDSKGCDTVFPSAYIRPDHYIDWIKSITGLDFGM